MNILIIGSGGREHALAVKFSDDDRVKNVYVYPGNPGMELVNKIICFQSDEYDEQLFLDEIRNFAIKFAIIGPESFIASGFGEKLEAIGIKVIAPSINSARLETSKIYSKFIMDKYSIPTARAEIAYTLTAALETIETFSGDFVLKLSGLHAGKGVFIPTSLVEAKNKLIEWEKFLEEGIIIEEKLIGFEVSMFYLCRGTESVFIGEAADHKRIFNGDLGPNTGGMGCFSPHPLLTSANRKMIKETFVDKTLIAMNKEGNPFKGILFIGLMITEQGPYLLEYNVRFGDPETQTILPLIASGFLDLFLNYFNSNAHLFLENVLCFKNMKSIHVVKASAGYPENVLAISEISMKLNLDPLYFLSGIKLVNGKFITNGGRVCGLTALGNTYLSAFNSCYENLNQISFKGEQFRTDIGESIL